MVAERRRRSMIPLHISEVIQHEMNVRGWTREQLAMRMAGDAGRNIFALDLIMDDERNAVHSEQIKGLSKAFGISEQYWQNIHDAWTEDTLANAVVAGPRPGLTPAQTFKRFVKRNGHRIVVLLYFIACLAHYAFPGLFPDSMTFLFEWVKHVDA